MAATTRVRVYVGGLPADVTTAELTERFSRFVASESCALECVELLPPKGILALGSSAAAHRGFAYLTVCGDAAASATAKLVKTYHKTKWRGSVLRVEPAKPDYLEQLALEWREQREAAARQAAALAEARGLVAAAALSGDVAAVNVGGVAFCGTKRTTFEYDDMDLATTFASRPTASVVPQAPWMPEPVAPESEASEASDDDADDADYWATSGDESEAVGAVKVVNAVPVPIANASPSSDASSDGSDAGSDHATDDESDAVPPAAEAVAVDDVEAFVQQMLAEQEADAPAVTPESQSSQAVPSHQQPLDREAANARRIAALEAKRQLKLKTTQQQQQTLALGLHIDAAARPASGTKITFDDSGNEQSDSEHDVGSRRDAATDSHQVIANWLGSSDDEGDENGDATTRDYSELRDGSDDDEGDDDATRRRTKRNALEFLTEDGDVDTDVKAFAVRPEFLGARGKRLFELQKRFGGDQRFRMDARFIDDAENEFGDGVDDVDDDDLVANDSVANDDSGSPLQPFQQEVDADVAAMHEREWRAEQDAALAAVASLFPDVDIDAIKYRLRVKRTQDPVKEASWMGAMPRYDPRDAHARLAYELPVDRSSSTKTNAKTQPRDGDTEEEAIASVSGPPSSHQKAKDVVSGGDRFFETSSSLGRLFTRVRRNSEDGIAGEAALDGVFRAAQSDGPNDDATSSNAATFKLSSLFDFPVAATTDSSTNAAESQLRAMGETLFEEDGEGDANAAVPWHFAQMAPHFSDDRDDDDDDDRPIDTDGEDDHDDEGDDDASVTAAPSKPAMKKSVAEFLAFGRAFVATSSPTSSTPTDWAERRRKLTLDFKRKRKDALRSKKKTQQRLARQYKKQRTIATGGTTAGAGAGAGAR